MKIAFQIDPIEKINFSFDTGWQLILEAYKRGEVFYYTPKDLFWKEGEVLAKVRKIDFNGQDYVLSSPIIFNLAEMDFIFIRQDPPYDMAYITATYILEKLPCKVINDPKALRDFPEKLSVLEFTDLIPSTLITSSFEEAYDFAKKQDKVIIKPLYSFGGSDIFCVKYDDINFKQIFENLLVIYKTHLIIQQFLPEVKEGDKRIFLIDGEPVGCFTRKPQSGDIRANIIRGGEIIKSELSSRDVQICTRIEPLLKENGLFLAGIDIIGGFLTEINITSPTGIVPIKKLYNPNIVKEIWDEIESFKK